MRIAVYTRISRDDRELDPGVGVRDQERQCRELIGRRFPDAEIIEPDCQCAECVKIGVSPGVYCDNDISASGKKRRPHYERLLDDIRLGRVDAIVAVHNDRLHRSNIELEPYMKACRDIPSYFVKSTDLDLSTASGRMVARMLGAAATAELERTQERITAAKMRNRLNGERSGSNAPFGYERDERDERGRQTSASRGLRIVPEEAEAVRRAYRDVLAGVSLISVARSLNQAGLKTHRQARGRASMGDGAWKPVTVRHMLLRASNAGLIEFPASPPGRGQIIGPAKWEPIVSEDTYLMARALLTDPSRRRSPGREPAHLLTGVLVCGVCGCHYFGVQFNRGTRFYICDAASKDPSKYNRHLARKADALDEYVTQIIVARLSRPDVVSAMNARPEVDIHSLVADRNGLQARLDEYDRMAATGEITARQLANITRDLQPRIDEAERKLSSAYEGPGLQEFTAGAEPAKIWESLPLERKRAVAKTLLRVRLLPVGNGGGSIRKGVRRGMPFAIDPATIEILPPGA